MKFYHKQPIEAEQFDGSDEMAKKYSITPPMPLDPDYTINTLEGDMVLGVGDWVATGVTGEHWAIQRTCSRRRTLNCPVIPENVAYIIKQAKKGGYKLGWVFNATYLGIWRVSVGNWIRTHAETFARAWLDGYEIDNKS